MGRRRSNPTDQPALFDYEKPPEEKTLYAHPGILWPCGGTGPVPPNRAAGKGCPICRQTCADAIKGFRAKVRAGEWNRQGYTRNEWKNAGRDPAAWKDAPGFGRFRRLEVPD